MAIDATRHVVSGVTSPYVSIAFNGSGKKEVDNIKALTKHGLSLCK